MPAVACRCIRCDYWPDGLRALSSRCAHLQQCISDSRLHGFACTCTGRYQQVSGASDCIDCPLGTAVATAGRDSVCPYIPAGYYCNSTGVATPTPCPRGSFASNPGSLACQPCGLGEQRPQR